MNRLETLHADRDGGLSDYGHIPLDVSAVTALIYLAIPNLIFSVGWFRWPFSVPLCGAILFSLAKVLSAAPRQPWQTYPRPVFLLMVAISLGWSAFGGGSHFVYANPDWTVRDAALGDLTRLNWPVSYLSHEGTEFILRSAIGYFLPLALFAKLVGTEYLDIAIFAWTSAGVFIFLRLLPLPRDFGWRLILSLMLVVFFSGMDFLGELIATESLPPFPLRLEWWVPISYPSLTNQLLWAPNHSLPIWIGTLLVFRHLRSSQMLLIATTTLPLTLIWTPFAAIGIAPFIAFGLFTNQTNGGLSATPWTSLLAALIISVPIGLFLTLDIGHINSTIATGESAGSASYTLQTASFRDYVLFVSFEFLFLVLTLAPHIIKERALFWLAVTLLLAIPLFRLGPSNDLGLRLSTPPLLAILIACLQTALVQPRRKGTSSLILAWLFLAIGGLTPFYEFWRAATYHRWLANYETTLPSTQSGLLPYHYVGALNGFAIGSWLKKPSGTPAP